MQVEAVEAPIPKLQYNVWECMAYIIQMLTASFKQHVNFKICFHFILFRFSSPKDSYLSGVTSSTHIPYRYNLWILNSFLPHKAPQTDQEVLEEVSQYWALTQSGTFVQKGSIWVGLGLVKCAQRTCLKLTLLDTVTIFSRLMNDLCWSIDFSIQSS